MAGTEGTVRGAFDLDVGPALRGVRSYTTAAAAADVQTRELGDSIDDVFGPRTVTTLRTAREEMGGLGTTSRDTRTMVRDQWKGMRREVEREAAGITSAIAVVRDRMRALGRERATPTIDLDGVARAIAQVELLQKRLAELGATRSTPRVGLGGGGYGSAAARAAAGAGGGGRGGGSGIVNLGGVGFAGVRGGTLLAAGALALPAARSLGFGATAVGASAASGALGAGAAGLGGLGPFVAGIGAVVAVAKPAQKSLQEVWKAQDALTKAVRDYGRNSDQAVKAQRELNRLQREAGPGSGYAAQQARGFVADWRRQTGPARQQYFGLLGDVAQVGRRVSPLLAQDSLTATSAVRGQGTRFARFLADDETQTTLAVLTRTFARELPTAERTLENMTLTTERLTRAAVPYFHEANVWVRETTEGWRSQTRDIEATRDRMRPLVQSAKDWAGLTGSTFRLMKDIGSLGRPSGDSLVVDLTHTMDRWDAWVQTHPEQVRETFSETADSVRDMARGLASAVSYLNQLASVLRPILDRFSQLVSLSSQFGLIGTPGLGAAALGAYRSFRGGGEAAAAAAAAGGGGGMGGAAGGAAALAAGAAAARGRGGWARVLPAGSTLYGRRVGRTATAPGFRGGSILEGGATRRYGLSRVGSAVGRTAMGAGRAYLPIGLALSALDFASFDGSFGQRAQAGLSSFTLGAIPRPQTSAQVSDAAGGYVQDFVGGLRGNPRQQLAAVDARIRELSGKRGLTTGQKLLGGNDASFFGLFGTGKGDRLTDDQMRENRKRIDLLRQERDELAATNRAMERQKNARLDEQSRQRAAQYGAQVPAAYGAYRRGGLSREGALGNTLDQLKDRLKNTRDAGVETLGEAGLAWARALKNKTPAMKKEIDSLTDAIEARYRRMGQRVQVVNGDILTGSRSEWRQIRDAMSDPVEQARQRISSDMTEIQNKAIASLMAMGFSRSQARTTIRNVEQGAAMPGAHAGQGGPDAAGDLAAGARGTAMSKAYGKKARGGMIGGRGLMDTVPVGDGLAAPGEGLIANRHTLAAMSAATVARYGLTAQQMIAGETRPHWMGGRYARGGLVGVNAATADIAQAAMAKFAGLQVTSTTGGRHAKNSLHYRGAAVDLAGGDMNAAAAWIGQHYGKSLAEGIHNPNLSVKNGQTVGSSTWGSAVWDDHRNHIHVGVLGGGGARGSAGILSDGGLRSVKIGGVGRRQAGLAGVMRQRAGDIYAAGLQQRVNAMLGSGSGGDLSGFSGGGDAAANQALGRRMMLAAGWGAGEWPSLRELWTGESGWRSTARNASSGAFGIPQALPASKMGAAAVAGDAAAQIRWGLGYIRQRYGSPSQALSTWKSRSPHWYEMGGRVRFAGAFDRGGSFITDGPTAFVAGEGPRNRREKVKVTPAPSSGKGGHEGVTVKIEAGAVVVHLGGGGDMSKADAKKIGEEVVREIIAALDRGATSGVIG